MRNRSPQDFVYQMFVDNQRHEVDRLESSHNANLATMVWLPVQIVAAKMAVTECAASRTRANLRRFQHLACLGCLTLLPTSSTKANRDLTLWRQGTAAPTGKPLPERHEWPRKTRNEPAPRRRKPRGPNIMRHMARLAARRRAYRGDLNRKSGGWIGRS